MKCFFLAFTLLITTVLYAQTRVNGEVKDSNNNPVGFVNIVVTAVSNPSKIICFTTCNENGFFVFNTNEKEFDIEASAIGYKKQTGRFKANQAKIMIALEEEHFELKEVTVETKAYKDTVVLRTEQMNLTQNSTLRDILNKNNGFEVSKNGAIIADGKPITKILINKKEVFVNQNSIALDNVTNDMIKNIQLINNYKDKFNLDFDNRKTSVINIETKDSFKGVAKFDIEAAYGYKNKYLLKGKGMFFSDKFNSFLTQNTNNVISRDFNFENLSESYKNTTSTIFNNTINPFIDENKSVNKDFSNGSSFIVRKEFNKFKISSVVYYNHLNQAIQYLTNKRTETNTINDETAANKVKSNFTSFSFLLNYFLSSNTILLFEATAGLSDKKGSNTTTQQNYFPVSSFFGVNDQTTAKTFIFTEGVTLKKLIRKNLLITSNLVLFNEKSDKNLASVLSGSGGAVTQDFNLKNNHCYGDANMDYSFAKLLNIVAGIDYSYAAENLESSSLKKTNDPIVRKDQYAGIPIAVRGDNDQISYIFKITPTLREIDATASKTHRYIPVTASIYYKLSRKKTLNLFFESKFRSNDIFKSADTTYTSFNNRTISDRDYNLQLHQNKSVGFQYSYNSLSKSKYFSSSLGYNQVNKALQNIFLNFGNNIIFYKTIVIENQKAYSLNIEASKGFYFSKNLHKITLKSGINANRSDSYTFFENKLQPITNTSIQPRVIFSFEPQKTFFKELNLSFQVYKNQTDISSNRYDRQATYTNYLEMIGEKGKIFYNIKYFYNIAVSQDQKFYRNDIDFSIKYKLTDKMYLSCRSNSLLTLLNGAGNNISNLSVSTSEGIKTTTINPSILAYLIAGIQFKF